MSYYRGTVLVGGPLLLGSISKTTNIFWNILGFTYWRQSKGKNDSGNFCLFDLWSYNNKSKFTFYNSLKLSLVTTTKVNLCFKTLLSLALWIFEAFFRIFLIVDLSLNQTLLTFFLCVRQTWMTQLILAVSLWEVIFL